MSADTPRGSPRVAVVTGAARGIGAATVRTLAGAGWRVIAVDRCANDPRVPYPLGSKDQLAALAAEHPDRVVDVVADVGDLPALRDTVTVAEDRFGRLDAAIAAAGIMAGGQPLWETEPEDFDALFDVGVHGVANLARATIPALLRRPEPRSGRFVALASAAAHRGLYHLAGYTAAKHAVIGLIRALAHDLRGTGITATAVSPGSTHTDMLTETARLYHLNSPHDFAQHQLIGRLLEPDEVAATVVRGC
ncbi:mycofactocin-coupled SDR family oxidoreductase [Haloechinothrix salitolerans]|uniref:Mycofactocin-coupled SDR family oxidoreductase n=1 Tax=Haloechinothrix salitolerans TaxID=926830 RepID=A0ABW2C0C1_9PSEU